MSTGFHVVFFIFIVSNVGGCLTPIGDPPLYLGFLRGVPFGWVLEQLLEWLADGCLDPIDDSSFVGDSINFRRAPKAIRDKETAQESFSIRGLPNLAFVGMVLIAIFLPKSLQETLVGGVLSVPAIVMIAAAVASYFTTQKTCA